RRGSLSVQPIPRRGIRMKPAMFLDRDGTVIVDCGYPRDPAEVRLLPGAANALRVLQERGFLFVIVSNQSGIARGLVTPAEAAAVHARTEEILAGQGIRLTDAYYCPHAPEERCPCRKPSPHSLQVAAAKHGIDLARSFMIGDRPTDP